MLRAPLHLIRRVASRTRRDERGMTLIELLVVIGGATAVIMGAYAAMQVSMTGQVRIEDRIDVTARGRLGMERITRDIRAQQCLPGATEGEQMPAMVIAADYFLEFYTSVAPSATDQSVTQRIERRRLEWTPVASTTRRFNDGGPDVGNIVETVWRSESRTPPFVFPARTTPTFVNVLATDVQLQAGQTAIFRYYGYAAGDLGRPSSTPLPLTTPSTATQLNPTRRPQVADNDLAGIVMADVKFAVRPRHAKVGATRTLNFTNRVSVRTADPYDPTRRPFCL